MKSLQVILTCLLVTSVIHAQFLEVAGGVKSVDIEKGSIDFVYVDESPAPDIIITQVSLKGRRSAVNIAFDYESFRDEKKLFGLLRLQGYLGEVNGVDLSAGIAYPLYLTAFGSVRLHPEMCLAFGYNEKKLGALNVQAANSVYIQVNDTRYADFTSVDIASQNTYFALRPGIKAAFQINAQSELRLFTGYHIGIGKVKSSISFSAESSSGGIVTEQERLGDPNVFFRVNGETSAVNPFSVSGLELRIGFAVNL